LSALGRTFRPCSNLAFEDSTAFVMTQEGLRLVSNCHRGGSSRPGSQAEGSSSRTLVVPCWDLRRRELTWDGLLVKKFLLPAPNQEIVFAAFEEEGWPYRIDDPLPGSVHVQKIRLHDTIKCLNKNQKNRCIAFRGDGQATGICWEPIMAL
jgi:hypothetical protein